MTSIESSRPVRTCGTVVPSISSAREAIKSVTPKGQEGAVWNAIAGAAISLKNGASLADVKKKVAETQGAGPAVAALITSPQRLRDLDAAVLELRKEWIANIDLGPAPQRPSKPAKKDEVEQGIPGSPSIPDLEPPVGKVPASIDELVAFAKGTHTKPQIFSMLAAMQGSPFGATLLGMLSKVGSQVPDFGNDTKAQLAFFQHMESVAASALQSLDTREDVSSIIKRMNDGTPAGAIASKVCASADDIKLLWAMLSLQNAAVA